MLGNKFNHFQLGAKVVDCCSYPIAPSAGDFLFLMRFVLWTSSAQFLQAMCLYIYIFFVTGFVLFNKAYC